MILTRNMFIYLSCYFDIDEGHSDRFKWCIVQTEASPGKPDSNIKTRSEMGYRFSGWGLKRVWKNHICWSEIGSGLWGPCGTPPPNILGSTLPPPPVSFRVIKEGIRLTVEWFEMRKQSMAWIMEHDHYKYHSKDTHTWRKIKWRLEPFKFSSYLHITFCCINFPCQRFICHPFYRDESLVESY